MRSRGLLRFLRGCRHDGPLAPVKPLGSGADLWRCALCGGRLVVLDLDIWAAEQAERRS